MGRGPASLSASLDTWRSEHPHTAGCLGRPTARSARARARGRRLADPPENLRRQSQAATHDRLDAARVHAGCAQAAHHVAGGVQLALQALRVALGASIRRAGVRRPPPRPPAAAQRSATAALWFNPIDANPLGFAPIGRYCWWLPRRGGRGGARWPRVRRRRASGRPRPPSRPAPARASRPAAAAATVYPDVRQFTLSESRPRGASPGAARGVHGARAEPDDGNRAASCGGLPACRELPAACAYICRPAGRPGGRGAGRAESVPDLSAAEGVNYCC